MKFAIKRTVAGSVKVVAVVLASLFTQPALTDAGDPSDIDASRYPLEALRLADSQIPQLASAIAACDTDSARQIREKVTTFINGTWNWSTHYEKLKGYRACFQLLSDIAAGTQLVSRHGGMKPRTVLGLLDANYASCQKLADPNARSLNIDRELHWPKRLGQEPQAGHCSAASDR